jgi:hypothetical protein
MSEALNAHFIWKDNFDAMIHGVHHVPIDPTTVAEEQSSEIGKWLHNQECQEKWKDSIDFMALVNLNKKLHSRAAIAMVHFLNGKYSKARTEITVGFYAKISLEMRRMMMRLWCNEAADQNNKADEKYDF